MKGQSPNLKGPVGDTAQMSLIRIHCISPFMSRSKIYNTHPWSKVVNIVFLLLSNLASLKSLNVSFITCIYLERYFGRGFQVHR